MNNEKIKTLYQNVDYIITGSEDGWLYLGGKEGQKILELCYFIKTLSEHSYDELFKFNKSIQIKTKNRWVKNK